MSRPDLLRSSSVAAIIVAAGSGTRFGGAKQYEQLGDRRVLDWSLEAARQTCGTVVLVVAPERIGACESEADVVVAGGHSRSASVRAGLAGLGEDIEVVVVHDAARPLAGQDLFRTVIEAVRDGADAAVPGVALVDTLRHRESSGEVVDRDELVAVQTPQAFAAGMLRRAHAQDEHATDDATLVDALGGKVVVVPGHARNRKITEPDDLVVARVLLDSGEK